jgi:hypothetical protein
MSRARPVDRRPILALLVSATLLSCQVNFSVTLEPGATAQQVRVRIWGWHHPSDVVRDLEDVVVRPCSTARGDQPPEIWRLTRLRPFDKTPPMIVTLGQSAPDGWTATGSIASFAPGCYSVSATSSAGHGYMELQVAVDGTVTELLTSRHEMTN